MGRSKVVAILIIFAICSVAFGQAAPKHNVIIFVADGLRHGSVNAVDTPALWRVRTEGSIFGTVTQSSQRSPLQMLQSSRRGMGLAIQGISAIRSMSATDSGSLPVWCHSLKMTTFSVT